MIFYKALIHVLSIEVEFKTLNICHYCQLSDEHMEGQVSESFPTLEKENNTDGFILTHFLQKVCFFKDCYCNHIYLNKAAKKDPADF